MVDLLVYTNHRMGDMYYNILATGYIHKLTLTLDTSALLTQGRSSTSTLNILVYNILYIMHCYTYFILILIL